MAKQKRRKAHRKWAFVLHFALLLWLGILAVSIVRYGNHDHAAKADCIIVLGAAVNGAKPSPVYEERLRHAVDLYKKGYSSKVIFTGGFGANKAHSEGAVGRDHAVTQGVPVQVILIEERSTTTKGNLEEAAALMRQHGLKSAIIVSDPLHLKRAMVMAEDLGMQAVSSPTPTTRYESWKSKGPFLLRELYFMHHYWVVGE